MKKLLLFLLLGLTCLQAYAQLSLFNGLVARYDLNGNTVDSTGHNPAGIVYKATLTKDRFGKPNKAYYFRADSQSYIQATIANLPVGDSDRTLNAWIKWAGTPFINAAHAVNYGGNTSGTLFGTGVYQNNNWFLFSYDYPAGYDLASGVVADTAWHMITGVYKSKVMMIYVDGVLKAAQNKVINTQLTDLYIGSRPDKAFDSYFTGAVDDILIYKRALSETEITSLFQAPLAVPTLSSEPVAVYPVPAADYVYLRPGQKGAEAQLTDMTGRVIVPLQPVTGRISLEGLAAGTYLLQVTDGRQTSYLKISKL